MAGRRRNNTQTMRDKQKLVRDFEERLAEADPVQTLRRSRSVAIVIHPTADETELLQRIGWNPSKCESVDAYFRYRDSVYWVELAGQRVAGRPPGIYYLFDSEHRQDVLKVALGESLVYSWDLHRALDAVEALIARDVISEARPRFDGEAIRLADFPGLERSEASGSG